MIFVTYVLWSYKLQKRYVGSTSDLSRRLKEHNSGETPFTSRGCPWELIYQEEFQSNIEARKREIFLKSGVGRKWLDEQFPKYRRGGRVVEGASLEN